MGSNASKSPELPDALLWLKDAPLFIDADQVARFYDAVVRPSSKEGARTVMVSEQKVRQITGKLGLPASRDPVQLASSQ
jgi:hypothetical protein